MNQELLVENADEVSLPGEILLQFGEHIRDTGKLIGGGRIRKMTFQRLLLAHWLKRPTDISVLFLATTCE